MAAVAILVVLAFVTACWDETLEMPPEHGGPGSPPPATKTAAGVPTAALQESPDARLLAATIAAHEQSAVGSEDALIGEAHGEAPATAVRGIGTFERIARRRDRQRAQQAAAGGQR